MDVPTQNLQGPHLTRRGTLAAATAILLSGGRVAFGADNATPRRGGTLTALITPEPVTLNRGINSAMPTGVIGGAIVDGLVRYGFDLALQPQLAESWDTAPDRRTITFHLRRNVRWHDGTPFTSADVKWTVENIWKVLLPNRMLFETIESVEAPDDATVVIHFVTSFRVSSQTRSTFWCHAFCGWTLSAHDTAVDADHE